jgi:hypothetical protein
MSTQAEKMYPHLAKSQPEEAKREGVKGSWWEDKGPLLAEPRQAPSGLDRVPGLRRKREGE